MSRESEWIKFILNGNFPFDVEFGEGSKPNRVIVEWEVIGSDGAPRRNAPFVIVINPDAIDRYESSSDPEQARIETRVREIVAARRANYDPNDPVEVAESFVVEIDEGGL